MKIKELRVYLDSKADSGFQWFYKHSWIFILVIATILALVARYAIVKYPTNDIVGIVFSWMNDIEKVGFNNMWQISADYSPIYIFMIGLFTLLPKGPYVTDFGNLTNSSGYYLYYMYYLKSVMFFFDLLLAVAIFFIVYKISKNKNLATIGYGVFLFLPVQVINSAMWGQCDSFYTCCFAWSIYFLMRHKGSLALFIWGLAISVKLQAIFFAPAVFYMILRRRAKLYQLVFTFAALMITFIPFYVLGAPFSNPFNYIVDQVGGYSDLTLGAGSIWHLFNYFTSSENAVNTSTAFSIMATATALLAIGMLTAVLYFKKIDLTDKNVVLISIFLIGICPFFLPHMHERYFYPLDVLVLVYALVSKKKYYLVPFMQVSSLIAYYHYLSGKYFIEALGEDSVHICTFINLAVLIIIFIDLLKLPKQQIVSDREKEKIEKMKSTLLDNI